ncbi:MAG TPA: methyltransferase domain-containing protein [Thermomicrobiales bacterium]|nr:methyltransferase domain-containing protein [Thermomicrobiales bacterium]
MLPRRQTDRTAISRAACDCEADVVAGIDDVAHDELDWMFGTQMRFQQSAGRDLSGSLRFAYTGDLRQLLRPRTVQAVHLVLTFPVPRPRALLGDEHFRALLAAITLVRDLHPPGTYQTLYLSAAGAESAVLTRLKEELARHTGLAIAAPEGDLQLRLRRPRAGGPGWEVLIRLSPRPLATRPWRVCNLEGALNATVARAMAVLTAPHDDDVFLNLACGSGSLLIERALCAPAYRLIGCDTSPAALACARENCQAANLAALAELDDWDAGALPIPDAAVDALCADLPFGHLVGSHTENVALYPRIMREAARVARRGARFALLTHEVRLMESVLAEVGAWETLAIRRVALGGLHPRIFVLRRR